MLLGIPRSLSSSSSLKEEYFACKTCLGFFFLHMGFVDIIS